MGAISQFDAVQLKHGYSPVMTVRGLHHLSGGTEALCFWIDKRGRPQSERYPIETLRKAA